MQKKKSGVKKCLAICAIKGGGGGVRRLMANAILNFHFDYPHTSLIPGLNDFIFMPQKEAKIVRELNPIWPGGDERQWLSAGYAWHSRPRTTTLSSNLRNGGDESG